MEPIDNDITKGGPREGRPSEQPPQKGREELPHVWEEAVCGRDGVRAPPAIPRLELGPIESELRKLGFDPLVDGNVLADPQSVASLPSDDLKCSQDIPSLVTVADVGVHRFSSDRDKLRRLHHLFERSAVSIEDRLENTPTSGFWLADSPGAIRRLLSVDGAQILVAVDNEQRLLGAYIYHVGANPGKGGVSPADFPGEDADLIREVKKSEHSPIPKGSRFGIGHMVVLDDEARDVGGADGAGPSRRDIMTAFHAAMIAEFRRHGVPWIVGYVRTEPAANTASKAHAAMGWEPIPECTLAYEYQYDGVNRSTVRNQVLALDVNSPKQDEIIAQARSIPGISFRDLDRS